MKKYIPIIVTILCGFNLFSQADFLKNFKQLSNQAYTEYRDGNYHESARLNVKVYNLLESNNVKDRYDSAYNAACTFALAGNFDKAFAWLDLLKGENELENYQFRSDKDLRALKEDFRWDRYDHTENEVKNNIRNKSSYKVINRLKKDFNVIIQKYSLNKTHLLILEKLKTKFYLLLNQECLSEVA